MRILGAAIAFILVLATPAAGADTSCGALISALLVEASAEEVGLAADPDALGPRVEHLRRKLEPHLSGADAGRPPDAVGVALDRYFRSRAAAVRAFQTQGADAGRRIMANPRYLAAVEDVRRLAREFGCSDAAVAAEGEGRGSLRAPSGLKALLVKVQPGTVLAVLLLLAMVAMLALLIFAASWFDNRREKRYPCALETLMRLGEDEGAATIVNLSRSGAQIRTETPLTPKRKCALLVDGDWVEFRVTWVNQKFAGGQFRRKLKRSAKAAVRAMNARQAPGAEAGAEA